jgi:hypothetical protein
MNIYLLTQNIYTGYNTYDSAIVVAESVDEAKKLSIKDLTSFYKNAWPEKKEEISCSLIGVADEEILKGVLMSEFKGE